MRPLFENSKIFLNKKQETLKNTVKSDKSMMTKSDNSEMLSKTKEEKA